MKISWKKYRLPLEAFTISKGTFHYRNCLIIRLQEGEYFGLGEATEISYYNINLNFYISLLESNRASLQAISLDHPKIYFEKISGILGDHPFLISALDCAAWDLFGKVRSQPTRELLSLNAKPYKHLPLTSFTIGLGSPAEVVAKIRATPWPIYKLKLGGPQDLEILETVSKITGAQLRVDANGGWTTSYTKHFVENLGKLNLDLIEQPLPATHDDAMSRLKNESEIPYIADESCQGIPDVQRSQVGFHGINIKLMKCGGLTPAMAMIELARSLDLVVMIGCMTESSIGISAAAQLLPWADFADLDGAMLITEDIATGVKFNFGAVEYQESSGHGCDLIKHFDD